MNRNEDASRYLQQAAGIDANHPGVVQLIFIMGLREKDWELAEKWARRAARLNLDGVDGKMFAARLAVTRGDLDKGVELLEEIKAINPRSKRVKVMVGDCYRVRKQYDRAGTLYEEVIRVDSSYVHAVIGMAILTDATNKTVEHRTWVERANQLPAGRRNEYIRKEYLKIMEARAKPEELPNLLEERSRRLVKDPNDLQNAHALAVLMEKVSRLTQAEQLLRHVYNKSTSKLNGARPLAAFYARHNRQGDLVNFLSEVETVEPDKVGLQILVGDTLGYYDPFSAERAYRKAIEVNSQDRRGHLAMGRFLDGHGRWKEAIRAYRAYLKLVPGNRLAPLLVIRCQLNDGQLKEAENALRNVLADDPTNPEALTLRGS
ncbi:MAG: tetratricopeptide repeat protein, partial [Phycisphaerae bacterium]|nr:tetratricopeptide repeat protein [Phycisphaerae bacterium]